MKDENKIPLTTPDNVERMATVAHVTTVRSLAEFLHYAKCSYYSGRYDPLYTVHDEEYDKIEDMLKRLCPNHPILEVVGIPSDSHYLTLVENTKYVKEFRNSKKKKPEVVEQDDELLGGVDDVLEDDDLL